MIKQITRLLLVAIAMLWCSAAAAQGYQTTIPFTETFDDDTHFTQGGEAPDGWAISTTSDQYNQFSRYDGSDTQVSAHSGSYYMASYGITSGRRDVLYTPLLQMEANTEYNISLYIYADSYQPYRNPSWQLTAGTGQSVNEQTIEITTAEQITWSRWQQVTATFVPTESGTYSIALHATCGISQSGFVYVDDFSIEQGATVTPPSPDDPYNTTVPFTETYDDDSHYAQGGSLPDGWATAGSLGFAAINGSEQSITAHSGSKIVYSPNSTTSSRADYLFTPMLDLEAYTIYNISFYLKLTGGTSTLGSYRITAGDAQTAAAQTTMLAEGSDINYTDWTLVETTFTPTTSGQYSIAVIANSVMSNCGYYAIDDFSVTIAGTAEAPEEPWEPAIPYAEDFDDGSHYDGVSYLPIGWYSTGENIFFTASSNSIPAVSGQYYMIAPSSVIANRRDIAYSPMLQMEAGVSYVLSFYLCMPGDSNAPSMRLTWGDEQDSEFHTNVLLELTGERVADWRRYDFTVTPTRTAEYCFAFWAVSEGIYDGYICIDNFRLRRADQIFPPEAGFEIGNTLSSLFTTGNIVFPKQPIYLINTTNDADTYSWSISGNGATLSSATAINPYITFADEGTYTITLDAFNNGGTSQYSRTITVEFPEEYSTTQDCIATTNEAYDHVYQQAECPAFLDDGSVEDYYTYATHQNYVVGVNRYYRAFAERFDVPKGCEMDISSISFITHEFYLWNQTVGIYDENGEYVGNSNFDADKEFSVVVYSEANGRPGSELYRKTMRVDEIRDDYHSVRQGIQFDQAVRVNGSFYIALEFDELTIEPWSDKVLSRSYIGCDTRVHANGQTTLWVKPEAAIPGSVFEANGTLGQWCCADEFSRDLVGYSFGVMPWVTYGKMDPEYSGIGTVETVKVYASLDGQNYRLGGIKPGDRVRLYSANGQMMLNSRAAGSDMVISTSGWSKGVYVISVNGKQSIKVIK